MDLVFCTEAVFQKYDGEYFSATAPFGMPLWDRYLAVFDHITIIARVENVSEMPKYKLDSTKVNIIPIPRYKGINGAIKAKLKLRSLLERHAQPNRAYILRVPGQVGSTFAKVLKQRNIPYGVEVVGDPWDVMSSIGGKIAFILKRIGLKMLQTTVKGSSSVLYVTQQQLQQRYPAKVGVNTYAASNVKIGSDFYTTTSREYPTATERWHLLAIGSLEQLYKAPDVVIKAIALLKKEGISLQLDWLGGGRYLEAMREMAKKYAVSDNICFHGDSSRKKVEKYLNDANLFIHVSRTEGLPRAIIEAMAKGIPVIGTHVGGIPELIPGNCIIEPNNELALAEIITQFLTDSELYNKVAAANLAEALKYEDSILSKVRNEFYLEVKHITEK